MCTSTILLRRQAFELADGLFQQLAVQLVADRGDVAALLRAQDVAGAADFQVAHGDGEAGAHVAELLDRLQAAWRSWSRGTCFRATSR